MPWNADKRIIDLTIELETREIETDELEIRLPAATAAAARAAAARAAAAAAAPHRRRNSLPMGNLLQEAKFWNSLQKLPTALRQQLTNECTRCQLLESSLEPLVNQSSLVHCLWAVHHVGWTQLLKHLPGGEDEDGNNKVALSTAAILVTFGVDNTEQKNKKMALSTAILPAIFGVKTKKKLSKKGEESYLNVATETESTTAASATSAPPSPPPSPSPPLMPSPKGSVHHSSVDRDGNRRLSEPSTSNVSAAQEVLASSSSAEISELGRIEKLNKVRLKGMGSDSNPDSKQRWPLLLRQAREGASPLLRICAMSPDLELGILPTLFPKIEFAGLYREWFAAEYIIDQVLGRLGADKEERKKQYSEDHAKEDAELYFKPLADRFHTRTYDSSHDRQPYILQLVLEGLTSQQGIALDASDRAVRLAEAVLKLVMARTDGRSLKFHPAPSSKFTFRECGADEQNGRTDERTDQNPSANGSKVVFKNPMLFDPKDDPLDRKLKEAHKLRKEAEFSEEELEGLMGANLPYLIQDGITDVVHKNATAPKRTLTPLAQSKQFVEDAGSSGLFAAEYKDDKKHSVTATAYFTKDSFVLNESIAFSKMNAEPKRKDGALQTTTVSEHGELTVHCIDERTPKWFRYHEFKYNEAEDTWEDVYLKIHWHRVGSKLPQAGTLFSTGGKLYRVQQQTSLSIDDLAALSTLLSLCPPIDKLELLDVKAPWLVQLSPLIKAVDHAPLRIVYRPTGPTGTGVTPGLKATLEELSTHWDESSKIAFDLDPACVVEAGLRKTPLAFAVQTGKTALAKALLAARGATDYDRFLLDEHGNTAQLCAWRRLPDDPSPRAVEAVKGLLQSFVTAPQKAFKDVEDIEVELKGALVLDAGSGDCTLHAFVMGSDGGLSQLQIAQHKWLGEQPTGQAGIRYKTSKETSKVAEAAATVAAEKERLIDERRKNEDIREGRTKDELTKQEKDNLDQLFRLEEKSEKVMKEVYDETMKRAAEQKEKHPKWCKEFAEKVTADTKKEGLPMVLNQFDKPIKFEHAILSPTAWYRDLGQAERREADAMLLELQEALGAALGKAAADDKFRDKFKFNKSAFKFERNESDNNRIVALPSAFEGLYEYTAVRYAVASRMEGAPPFLCVVAGGNGSVQISGADTTFSMESKLKVAETKIQEADKESEGARKAHIERWQMEVAMTFNGSQATHLKLFYHEVAAKATEKVRMLCIGSFYYGAMALNQFGIGKPKDGDPTEAHAATKVLENIREHRAAARGLGSKWKSHGSVRPQRQAKKAGDPDSDLEEITNEKLSKALLEKQEFTGAEVVEFNIEGLKDDKCIKVRRQDGSDEYFTPNKDDFKDVANLARLETTLMMLFGELLLEHVEIVFCRNWKIDDKDFRTTWSAGWALCQFGLMPDFDKARSAPIELNRDEGKGESENLALRCAKGRFHYPKGTKLLVLTTSSDGKPKLVDAAVEKWEGFEAGNRHTLNVDGETCEVDLNELNHCLRLLEKEKYEDVRQKYCKACIIDSLEYLEDAITTKKLKIDEQLQNIEVEDEGMKDMKLNSVADLADVIIGGRAAAKITLQAQKEFSDELGRKWKNVGNKIPAKGVELDNADLSEALRSQLEFTQMEIEGFKLVGLQEDSVIKAWPTAGSDYFSPVRDTAKKDAAEKAVKEAAEKKMYDRLRGIMEEESILLSAGPGTGKTWSMQQLGYALAKRVQEKSDGLQLVPIILYCQKLVKLWSPSQDTSLLVQYIRSEFQDPDMVAMLLQAHEMRTLVVLLDGIDEAAGLTEQIQSFVLQVSSRCFLLPIFLGVALAGRPVRGATDGTARLAWRALPMTRARIVCRPLLAWQVLKPMRFPAVIISSRPEGVKEDGQPVGMKYKKEGFEVISLKALSDEQATAAVGKQLQGDDYFKNLQKIKKIREDHDKNYKDTVRSWWQRRAIAAPDIPHLGRSLPVTAPLSDRILSRLAFEPPWQYTEEERKTIEGCKVRNAFFQADENNPHLDSENRDPKMRQHSIGGRIVQALKIGDGPTSKNLKRYSDKFKEDDFLRKFNENLECFKDRKDAEKAEVRQAVTAIKDVGWLDELRSEGQDQVSNWHDPFLLLAVKLGLLHLKRIAKSLEGDLLTTTVEQLWDLIVSRTDEIMCTNEENEATTIAAVKELLKNSNGGNEVDGDTYSYGGIKDPVRIHEKAIDDYQDYFKGELAEANVVDVLRFSAKCAQPSQMTNLAAILRNSSGDGTPLTIPKASQAGGSGLPAEDVTVRLKTLRFKNKFAKTDPTHFRNILVNCMLEIGHEQKVFFELQSVLLPPPDSFRHTCCTPPHTAWHTHAATSPWFTHMQIALWLNSSRPGNRQAQRRQPCTRCV